jgi:predicted nucleic acid-binding protein
VDRLFLDANILVSAAWRSDSRVQRLWGLQDVALVSSTYAIGEAARHLERPGQMERLDHLLADVEIIHEWSDVSIPNDVVLREKDRPILQAAIAARATYLVTGDRQDFGRYFGQNVAGVEIILPATYLSSKL